MQSDKELEGDFGGSLEACENNQEHLPAGSSSYAQDLLIGERKGGRNRAKWHRFVENRTVPGYLKDFSPIRKNGQTRPIT